MTQMSNYNPGDYLGIMNGKVEIKFPNMEATVHVTDADTLKQAFDILQLAYDQWEFTKAKSLLAGDAASAGEDTPTLKRASDAKTVWTNRIGGLANENLID